MLRVLLMIWLCDDGNCPREIEADTTEEAAQEYVDGGYWGDRDRTEWVTVWCTQEGEEESERVTVTLEPDEPACSGDEHDWASPHEIVGGIVENPGVWGHGGGVVINEACTHCGCRRRTDTWATNPSTGEQGLTSLEYTLSHYEVRL